MSIVNSLFNKDYEWINNYTGECYKSLVHAVIAIILDLIHYPVCRTLQMFSIKKVAKRK